jgi:hypothetical protein
MATKVQKVMTQPINLIFRFLQSVSIVGGWAASHFGPRFLLCRCSHRVARHSHCASFGPPFLYQKARIQIMLFENVDMRIEGRIVVGRWVQAALTCSHTNDS